MMGVGYHAVVTPSATDSTVERAVTKGGGVAVDCECRGGIITNEGRSMSLRPRYGGSEMNYGSREEALIKIYDYLASNLQYPRNTDTQRLAKQPLDGHRPLKAAIKQKNLRQGTLGGFDRGKMAREVHMDCTSCLDNLSKPIVADASVVINLIASGFAATILGCLSVPLRVPSEVRSEIERGRSSGRDDADELAGLVAARKVTIVHLGTAGVRCFSTLVVGTAKDTLDDGEAATIAYAVEHGVTILIDEKKATRICGERFSHLIAGSTVDLVGCPAVRAKLGADLTDAIFNMLIVGRMRVSPQHLDWVVEQIGPHRAAQCPSLPARYRNVQ